MKSDTAFFVRPHYTWKLEMLGIHTDWLWPNLSCLTVSHNPNSKNMFLNKPNTEGPETRGIDSLRLKLWAQWRGIKGWEEGERDGEWRFLIYLLCQRSWRPWIWPKLNHLHLTGDDLKRDTADGPSVSAVFIKPLFGLLWLLPQLTVLCQINQNESKHCLISSIQNIFFQLFISVSVKMYLRNIFEDSELCWFWLWLSL